MVESTVDDLHLNQTDPKYARSVQANGFLKFVCAQEFNIVDSEQMSSFDSYRVDAGWRLEIGVLDED